MLEGCISDRSGKNLKTAQLPKESQAGEYNP